MTILTPFDCDMDCPKCMEDNPGVRFRPKAGTTAGLDMGPRLSSEEHLHLVCRRCGFDWAMKCADEEEDQG